MILSVLQRTADLLETEDRTSARGILNPDVPEPGCLKFESVHRTDGVAAETEPPDPKPDPNLADTGIMP